MMFGGSGRELLLSSGLFDTAGHCHRTAVLRSLSGREEGQLSMLGKSTAREAVLSTVLAACVSRIGDYEDIGIEHIRALTRGDRQRLTLWLRADLFGRQISLVLTCPNPSCAEKADLDFEIDQLIPPSAIDAHARTFELETAAGVAILRDPTGEDDELIESTAADKRTKVGMLWSRLLIALGERRSITPDAWWSLPSDVRQTIALGLADKTATLDLCFASRCPTCRAAIEVEIHPLELLEKELRFGGDRLLAEVHCLAWYYGWSEAEILALPRTRRWSYLELVRRQVEGRPLIHG